MSNYHKAKFFHKLSGIILILLKFVNYIWKQLVSLFDKCSRKFDYYIEKHREESHN